MSAALELRVPDIGDFKDIPIIDLLVKPAILYRANGALAAPALTWHGDASILPVPKSRLKEVP